MKVLVQEDSVSHSQSIIRGSQWMQGTDLLIKNNTKEKSIEETLQDTIETGFIIARRMSNKDGDLDKFNEVIKGIREFSSFYVVFVEDVKMDRLHVRLSM